MSQTGAVPDGRGGPVKPNTGSPSKTPTIQDLNKKISSSGARGKAFVAAVLKINPKITDAKYAFAKGSEVPTSVDERGGGFTWGPKDTQSGRFEVYIDTSLSGKIDGFGRYPTVGGGSVSETAEGVLLHEFGHVFARANGDTSPPGSYAACNEAIRLTNQIRLDMGMPAQKEY